MAREKSIKIYIAAHKKFDFPYSSIYTPIQVGAQNKNDLGYLKDNTKDNISLKNPNYCELTGLYWIWKNSDYKIVGLVHYRRFFYDNVFKSKKNIMTKEQILKALEKNDIIVAKRGYTWNSTVRKQYEKYHYKTDIDECFKIIKEDYKEYVNSFNRVFDGNSYCPLNMIITRKKIFDEYCTWLFSIMFKLEKRISVSDRDKYNQRVYGFLSERLFNVWLDYNKQYKYIEKPVFNNEASFFKQKVEYLIKKVIRK